MSLITPIGRRSLACKLALVLAIFVAAPPSYANLECLKTRYSLAKTGATNGSIETPVKRFPSNRDGSQFTGAFLRAGFESEYALADTGALLGVYGPPPEILPSGEWFAKTPAQKIEWMTQNKEKLFPKSTGLDVANGETRLKKLSQDPAHKGLPESLALDSTGNLEIILAPRDTLEELARDILSINKEFGTGSMQVTISTPAEYFFEKTNGQPNAQTLDANKGYFRFINESDALSKLALGRAKVQRNPDRPSMLNFLHQWLGPVTKGRQTDLENFLDLNSRDQGREPNRLKNIKGRDGSLKYYGSTVYRPDIGGPDVVALEIRDAHKTWETLRVRIVRSAYFLLNPRDIFIPANVLKPLDIIEDFNKFSPDLQKFLQTVAPSREVPGIPYYNDDRIALQVARNFAFPLKDWSGHVQFLGSPRLADVIARAQKSYVDKVSAIRDEFAANKITKELASIKLQKALTEFDGDTSISGLMDDWYLNNAVLTPHYQDFLSGLPPELSRERPAGE